MSGERFYLTGYCPGTGIRTVTKPVATPGYVIPSGLRLFLSRKVPVFPGSLCECKNREDQGEHPEHNEGGCELFSVCIQ